jgi:hypothetical protein
VWVDAYEDHRQRGFELVYHCGEAEPAPTELSVSHRKRLIEELRADPWLAAAYLCAAAEDGDPRVYLIARKTVARAQQ